MLMGAKRSSRVSWWNALELLGGALQIPRELRERMLWECSGNALGILWSAQKRLGMLRCPQECAGPAAAHEGMH